MSLAVTQMAIPSIAMSSAKQFVEKTVAAQPVVVFAKSTCPHCAKTRALLSELEVTFELVNLDQREDGAAIQNALEEITGMSFLRFQVL